MAIDPLFVVGSLAAVEAAARTSPPETRIVPRAGSALIGLCFSAVIFLGCQKQEQIERYTVKKPVPLEAVASTEGANPHAPFAAGAANPAADEPAGEPTDRTLAAIVTVKSQGWFFKLTGPKDPVAAQEETFTTFLKSVHFSDAGKPQWTLPAGWTEQPGSQIRYATLVIPAEGSGKPLEVSVTVLPNSGQDETQYALVNINRWRGQLRLPPIAAEQLASESTQVPLADGKATLVNLVGRAASSSMGRGPFQSGAGNGN